MSYFDSKNKKDCNGCGLCALKCAQKAITMVEDSEGFLYPKIDEKKCVNCGLCKKLCPNHDYDINNGVKTYIAINKDKEALYKSSSGGMFYAIAKYIFDNDGVVFGVTYDKNLKVIHDYATTLKDAQKFQGSKYVRSDLNASYEKVKDFLNNGKLVLFTGTPCQCKGLGSFIGFNERLVTCEILCHANPSPKVFELYVKNLEMRKDCKVKNVSFRAKKNGWSNQRTTVTYENGEEEEEINFFNGFVKELLNRPSCHNCHFSSSNRLSDFTIGDMWGIDDIDSSIKNDNTGISLLCVNTNKGNAIMKNIKDCVFTKEVNTIDAFKHNHHFNVPTHKNRTKFFVGISDGTITENNLINSIKKYVKRPLWKRILSKCKKIILGILFKLKNQKKLDIF